MIWFIPIVAMLIWYIAIFILMKANFPRDFKFIRRALKYSNEFSNDRKYHNEAIYKDFESFSKVALAIYGGAAFVATSKDMTGRKAIVTALLEGGGWLLILVAALATFFVFAHQKSKIERWIKQPGLWSIFTWQETWMVGMFWMVVALYVGRIMPDILAAL